MRRMLPLGVKLVQLRLKGHSPATLAVQIATARDLCRQHGAQLVVNDHWQQAIDAGCDAIHLGQEDLDAADLPAIRRAGLRLGISTHDQSELDRALALMPDYIALGPVYPTILKQMPWPAQGLDRLTEWKRQVGHLPLVAIGGMTIARAAGAFAAGANSVAAVTDITLHPDPEARLAAWIVATR
nr:thiamine phosphate synthase [Fertoeibacter niger]